MSLKKTNKNKIHQTQQRQQNKKSQKNKYRNSKNNTKRVALIKKQKNLRGGNQCGIISKPEQCSSAVNVGQYIRPCSYLPLDGPGHNIQKNQI